MRLSVKDPDPTVVREARRHFVVDFSTGQKIEKAFALDTDKGWVDVYVVNEKGRITVENGELKTRRDYIDYDVVNRLTNEVVARVRQPRATTCYLRSL